MRTSATVDGRPADLAAHPRSPWVAELVGLNLLRGRDLAWTDSGDVPVADLITPRVPLEEVHRAIDAVTGAGMGVMSAN
jgi:Zn-dependent alcohol dehydrogenase